MKLSEIPTTKPINVIVTGPGVREIKNDRPDVLEIDPPRTVKCADNLTSDEYKEVISNVDFMHKFNLVFQDHFKLGEIPLAEESNGIKHVIGLILLTNHAIQTGKQPFLRFPETYLHPRYQTGLADLMISFQKPANLPSIQSAAKSFDPFDL